MSTLYWAWNHLSNMRIISGTRGAVNRLKGDKAGYSYKALGLEASQVQGANILSKSVKEYNGTLALCGA